MMGNLRTFSKLGTQYYAISTSIQRITLDGKPTAIYNAANSANSVYLAFHEGVGNNNTSFVIPPGKSVDLGINSRPIYLVSAGTSFVYFAPAELKKGREIQEDIIVSYPLREMMVGGYSFNDTPNDISENGYDLTAVNSPTYNTGVHGNCAVLTGSEYFSLADGSPFRVIDPWWACGYVYVGDFNSARVISNVTSLSSGQRSWRLLSLTTGRLRFSVINSANGESNLDSVIIESGQWYWFLISLIGGTQRFYVDDQETSKAVSVTPNPSVTTNLVIGASTNGAAKWSGRLESHVFANGDPTDHLAWLQNSGSGRSAQQIYDYTGA